MRFSDKAFEKAYLRIIKESADMEDPMATDGDAEVCPDCGQPISYDEMGNPICDCSAGFDLEEDEDEECDDVEECDDFEEDEDEECDDVEEDEDEECDDVEEDEDEEDDDLEEDEDEEDDDLEEDEDEEDDEAEVDAETPAEGEDDEEAPAEGGKFISFYTTDPGLIEALQNGFATLSITPVAEDDKEAAEPVEFAADLFENLTVEDLKEDETAKGDDAAADVEAAEAEVADAEADAEAETSAK